ncbi:hypothetical protein BB559_005107 [Furculomyces boomerangus]|uniref:3-hydroxyanthranilate 3,4-dioxygenase n=1 Tax=Furculomyces boomerangus TaxID=61424 RepID=A0A2T9YAS8_9FUNG|nr:hypothetical protein BB559_005107 [Furculomyces boomerangus]
MSVLSIDFGKFIEENKHLLVPPVSNKTIFATNEYIVMVVGGPNSRTDYHVNQTEEFFYQLEGKAEVNIVDPVTGEFRNIVLDAGKMAIVPANTPHNPVRHAGSLGLVVERFRGTEYVDQMRWYCAKCKHLVHKVEFVCDNIDRDIANTIEGAKANDFAALICSECGHHNKTYREQ